MEVSTRPLRRNAALVKGVVVALASLAALTVQASPAAADDACGKQVGGAILAKYDELGRETGPLGCPKDIELDNPDGVGKRQEFAGGTIYWSAASDAHPVWGAIGDKWGALGYERGKLGYPVDDERTNPDGVGKRQQFQGGTVYWHPTLSNGAHPVWGRIGELWGQWGYERGAFGYPVTDEYDAVKVGGNLAENTGVRQRFQNDRFLLWSPGQANAFETCHSECVGYLGVTNEPWVKQTEVYTNLGNGKRSVHVTPTDAAFKDADDDLQENWRQVWANTPLFRNATQTEINSVSKQLYCHAAFAFPSPGGGHFGGPTWDLETWRADIPWDSAEALRTQCNWD
ncbi:DUF2599 domain-containing protein [Streptomyces sp. NPDC059679]|uniref:DUF2599 domain-containing protein n=1 Tax=Streptomyces sp. NPDC059679 TaxID=3346903 RepID=UPI00368314A6